MYQGSQLCSGWTGWPEGHSRVAVEPKFDGYRLNAVVTAAGQVEFYCRGDQQVDWGENLEHIADALRALPARDVMYDGELMAKNWNETASLVRSKRTGMSDAMKQAIREKVRLHVFDVVPQGLTLASIKFPRSRKLYPAVPVPQVERRAHLVELSKSFGPELVIAPQFEASSIAEVEQLADELMELGYEGAVVKLLDAPYLLDRGPYWMKIKPWETREVTVVRSVEGEGKHKGRLGAILCTDAKGVEVSVGGGFTDDLRNRLWAMRDEIIGFQLEIKVQKTDVSVARHPNFLRFRNDRNPTTIL